MAWNASKFQMLRMGNLTNIKEDTWLFSNGMEETIQPAESVKDLGILMDQEGSFKEQRAASIQKATQKSGWIFHLGRQKQKQHIVDLPTPLREQTQPLQQLAFGTFCRH